MKFVFYILLVFGLVLSMTHCVPAESDDEIKDEPETEVPEAKPLPPPVDPDLPGEGEKPSEPEADEPAPGEPAPGEPGPGPGELGPGESEDPDVPLTPDPALPVNPIVEIFSCNFVTSGMPVGYQTINANNLAVVQPSQAKIPFPSDPDNPSYIPPLMGVPFYKEYMDDAKANWHSYRLSSGTYAMTSYACDGRKDTSADNWLITDALDINSDKALIQWQIAAAVDADYPYPEYCEVYVSNSPELSDFKSSGIRIHQGEVYLNHRDNDRFNIVNYLLEGYKDKKIYLAFRHTSPGASKMGITLYKLTVSDFFLDKVDVEVSSMNCWWDCKPTNVTGLHYPIDAELTSQITIHNVGHDIKNTSFKVSYTYDGKTVTENTPNVSLKRGGTYRYEFKEKMVYNSTSGFTVNVAGLPGETRLYANYRTLTGLVTVKRPVMIRVLYEEASGLNCSVCSTLFNSLDQINTVYPNRTVGVMHIVDRAQQQPYPASVGSAYKDFVSSKSRPNQAPPYAAANRDKAFMRNGGIMPGLSDLARSPNLETPLIEDYTSVCYTPLEITATHRFSVDGKKMFVDVTVEALQDIDELNYGIGGLIVEDKVQHAKYTMLNLGAPVFNHLVRGVLGDMKKGVTGVIPSSMKDGQKVTHTFEYDIPEKYDVLTPNQGQMYAAVMLIRADESILTCNKTKKNAATKVAYRWK